MLNQQDATRIAKLINEIVVADSMTQASSMNGKWDSARSFLYSRDNAVLKLHAEFGIRLPSLESAQSRILTGVLRPNSLGINVGTI